MRTAEWVTALALMGLSGWFMWHATVLPIGWVRGSGPGGGAFPFWLGLIMFVCAAAIFLRELRAWRRAGDGGPFFLPHSWRRLLIVAGTLALTVGLIHVLGTYGALIAFLVFSLRVLGQHRWPLTTAITLAVPVFIFFFFEVTLKIVLPKGVSEPLFVPLYAIFF
ncbi:MAG: tripartite tricarboxylate transporter TctB family protein [Alphaproteobacteria bacterium]